MKRSNWDDVKINGRSWHAITIPGTKEEFQYDVKILKKHHAEWRWLQDKDLWRIAIPLAEAKRIEKKNYYSVSRRKTENTGKEISISRRKNYFSKQLFSKVY